MPEAIFVSGCHGNTEIHMCTKFHLHTLYGVQVCEVKKCSYWKKVPEAISVDGRHGNAEIHMCTKFHLHALYGVQVCEVKK